MIPPYTYRMPVEVVFAEGCAGQLVERTKRLGRRPLVVAGMQSARKLGLVDALVGAFPDAVVFEGIDENPGTGICDEGAAQCRQAACDCVVAIGGGSPMDAAKAIAGLALHEGPCVDFIGRDTFPNGALPILAVPTTSGSGSEVTPYAVLVNDATRQKATIGADCLFPRTALLDPALTLKLPRAVTVNTGLDALSQAMEGIVSNKANAAADVMAFEAIRLVCDALPIAVERPDDLPARGCMQHAAMLAGCVIAQTGTTLVHGMGYPLTMECGIAHGLANALLLTPLFQHNAAVHPGRVARIAEAMGHPCAPNPESAGKAIAAALHALLHRLGVSPAAASHGAHAGQLASFATAIAADPYRFRNQPGTLDESSCLRLYEQAYEGSIV